MNKLVCGIAVDEELYTKYQDKKYRIGKEEYALGTIEIMAASKDYDAYPYLKAQAQGVVEQVQEEIREYYAAKDGRKEYVTMKHDTFSEYIKDLQEIHAKSAPERRELKEKMDMAKKDGEKTRGNLKMMNIFLQGRKWCFWMHRKRIGITSRNCRGGRRRRFRRCRPNMNGI